jgi:hypothetical protein
MTSAIPAGLLSQQPLQLIHVEAVAAHDRAIEQQHWDVQTMPASERGVAIHVHHVYGRKRHPTSERLQLREHLIAELAVVAMHDGQT